MFRQLEEFRSALRYYTGALGAARLLSIQRIVMDARVGRAMALRGLGQYSAAIPEFRKARQLYRRKLDREGEAYAVWALGTTERFRGDLLNAERHLTAAVSLYRRLGDKSGLAYALCALGGTQRMLGLSSSRSSYAAAFSLFRRMRDQFGMAYSSCGQGNALRMSGDFQEARRWMNKAIAAYTRLRLYGPLGFVLWSRAQLNILLADLSPARQDIRSSRAAFRRAKDPRGLAYVTLAEGELARAAGKPGTTFYRSALAQATKLGLKLETVHAKVRMGLFSPRAYARLGVKMPAYLDFTTLP